MADQRVTLTLPWPPSVNTYWRHTVVKGRLRTLISRRGQAYRSAVYAAWLRCRDRRSQPIDAPVRVTMAAHPPDLRQRDLDNLPKAIFDALTHCRVWSDDYLVDDFRIYRRPAAKPGAVVLTIDWSS